MNNNKVSIQNIVGLFTIILGTHYFLSFRWFYGMLKIWGVDFFSVISIEDLTFPYAHLNISVLALSSLGFVGILWWDFTSNNNSNPLDNLKESIKLLKSLFVKQKWWLKVGLIIILISIVSFIYIVFKPLISLPNRNLGFSYLLILLGVPLIYILLPQKRNLVIGLQLFLMFSWANLFITTVLNDVRSNPSNTKIEISFEYKNRRIESSDSLIFLHHGYKYLIMKDTIGNIELFPSNFVEGIIYKKNDK